MASCKESVSKAITAKSLQGFKYFEMLQALLEDLHAVGTERDKAGNRQLFFDQYVILLLLYFFNPVVNTIRGIQQVSDLAKVQKTLGVKRTSLGSLSEAGNIFDPAPLREIVQELAGRAIVIGQKQGSPDLKALEGLTSVDGTFLQALPRMIWALWREDRHAAKMHLHFDVLKGVPCDATITPGASNESDQLRAMLQPGRLYVVDRGYANYRLFRSILDAQSSFIARVKDNTAFTVTEERKLDPAACAAGVTRDMIIGKLGTSKHADYIEQPLRIVTVDVASPDGSDYTLWLVTDRLDLPADMVALAYRYRWTVELFFRWFKCVLGCRHLVNESANGVTIQCYVALIASLMISIWTGLKPTKRTWEMIQLYMQGWASGEEVQRHLDARRAKELKPATSPAKAKYYL